jgi:hypothetical protein
MSSVNVDVRLRPVRFAFLVRPEDARRTLEIFRICTCLWGGKYNPIVPFFKRIPQWWERKGYRFESARQIVNGYLDFFEPDFLVESEKGLSNGLGFNPERVLPLSDILVHAGDRNKQGHGLGVFDLYNELYRKEFQFVRRHKHNIVDVRPKDRSFELFAGCVFGSFPKSKSLEYVRRAFKDVFDPQHVALDATTFQGLHKSGHTSALQIGHAKIYVHYIDHSNPALFVLNAHEPRDLIDYWNLRAVRREVMAIPMQWLDELSGFCRDLIKRAHRPLPGNPHGVMIRATVMFSRSIPENQVEDLHKRYFCVDQPGANVLQSSYPPIWRPSPRFVVRTTRPVLTAEEKHTDVQITDDKADIRLEPLNVDFAAKYGNDNRWANVVRLSAWSSTDRVATTFPCNYRNPSYPRLVLGGEHLLPTAEGLVFFSKYHGIHQYWSLPDGTTAINDWFKACKISARLSDSGRATQQIIQTLGGFWGVRSIASLGVIELLNEMTRKPISRSVPYAEFKNKIHNATKDDERWRGKEYETLVERNAVQLGLELKCPKCGNWSWYSIKQVDYTLTCDLCLKQFTFPIIDPGSNKNSKWAYRVIGPFALPNYAGGGYAASLAIRFFAEVVSSFDRSHVTWSSGQELILPADRKVEADFILWYQRKQILEPDYPTEVVFGEAKSLGKEVFKDDDVDRMKVLAEAFPGAVLVFATLKEAAQLSKNEISRIRKLAEWGRDYDRENHRTRAPVILLTGTELFTPYYLQESWKSKGDKRAALIEPGYIDISHLPTLADFTQQVYLDMPSYHEWSEARWKKRVERRKQRAKQVKATVTE